MKDEIKPLEAPAVTYINTSMAVQMHDCFTCKGERNKESRNHQKKEALVLLLVEKSESIYRKLTRRRPCAKIKAGARLVAGPALQPSLACHTCTCHVVACVHECAPFRTLSLIVQMVY